MPRLARLFTCLAWIVVLTALPWTAGHAQTDGAVRILVGFAPGGSADVIARILAERMRVALGQNVVVENRAGAGGRIALGETRRAAADGLTLLLSPSGPFVVFPHIFRRLDYDPVRDFVPVARVATFDFAVTAGPALRAQTLREMLEWAKAHPKDANYGSPGAGTLPHFVGLLLARTAGIELNHVAYKGGAPAMADLVGGQIPLMIDTPTETLEMHKAGKVRVLATTGERRSRALPDVPTLNEAGVDTVAEGFFAVYGPAGMPPETIRRLNSAIVEAVRSPEVQDRIIAAGLVPSPSTPEDMASVQAQHLKRWEAPIKASGFTAD
jgi:tripartite-type tricarboxylate transporter receptor subunit TctC